MDVQHGEFLADPDAEQKGRDGHDQDKGDDPDAIAAIAAKFDPGLPPSGQADQAVDSENISSAAQNHIGPVSDSHSPSVR